MSFFQTRQVFLLFLFICSSAITPAKSQSDRPLSRQFQWQFTNDGLGSTLPTCLPLGIIVESWNVTLNDTIGIPPYYMIAYAVGGVPVTTFIGTDNQTLSWSVTEAAGSKLMLNVVDSTGSSGGIPPHLFEVIAGQTTQCVTSPLTSPEFSLTSNVTGNLETCQPWGVTIKGGVPPYNISIAAVNSPVVTNLTIPSGYDTFTYINRADPNGQMIMAVSDLTGRWATGTPLVNTQGSTDTDCTGLVSSSGNSTLIKQQEAAQTASANKKRNSVIIGVCVTLGILILAGVGLGILFFLPKRRRLLDEKPSTPDLRARQFQAGIPSTLLANNFIESNSYSKSAILKGDLPPLPHEDSYPQPVPYVAPSASTPESGLSEPISHSNNTSAAPLYVDSYEPSDDPSPNSHRSAESTKARIRPGFTKFPTTSVRREKSAEAAQSSDRSPESEYPAIEPALSESGSHVLGHSISSMRSLTGIPGGPRASSIMIRADFSDENANREREEIIIQHRDGGLVRELPPPYADRSRMGSNR